MKVVSQRVLCIQLDQILREVEAGDPVRVTVRGRPVADLIPIAATGRRTFVPREEVEALLRDAPLDRGFAADMDSILGDTIDEL